MENKRDFEAVADMSDKERLTLWLTPSIKDELKRQAKSVGVSASAYVSVLVSERAASR